MSKRFINLGTRNKGTFWSWGSAYSFSNTVTPGTDYEIWEFMAFGQGDQNKHCHGSQVIEDAQELLIKEFNEGKYDEKFFEDLHHVYKDKLEKIKERCKKDYSKESNQFLRKEMDFVAKGIFDTHKPMLLALKTLHLNNFLEEEIAKVAEEDENIHEIKSVLLTPSKLTQIQKEQEDIIKELKKEEIDYKGLAEKHGWFHMEYMQEPWKAEDYKQMMDEMDEMPESPKKSLEEAKEKRADFFRNHPGADNLKKLSFVLREFSYLLDASKAAVMEGTYHSLELFNEIAKRLGTTRKEMLFLTPPGNQIPLVCRHEGRQETHQKAKRGKSRPDGKRKDKCLRRRKSKRDRQRPSCRGRRKRRR